MYHGNGGFVHSEVYNMPIWMRRFHIQKINKFLEKQNEEVRKQQGNEEMGDDKQVHGPTNTQTVMNVIFKIPKTTTSYFQD